MAAPISQLPRGPATSCCRIPKGVMLSRCAIVAAQISARDRDRMTKRSNYAPQTSHGLVEEAELAQHRSAVIVDPLAGQSVIGIECKDSAKPEFNWSACRRQSAPSTPVRTPDCDLKHKAVRC